MTTLPLANKVVVVTGGSGGIGSAICKACAAAGATLVITYNQDVARAEQLVAQLGGGQHMIARVPVDDTAAITQFAAHVSERYGTVDVLVNNAGMTRPIPHEQLDELDDELIDQIFRVNWRGAFACVRAFQPLLAAGDGGLIINMSSVAGTTGLGSNIAYCASKAALDSLTRSLARSLAPKIRVISVAPGMVEGEYVQRFNPAFLEEQRQRTPLKRIAEADDVANAVLAAMTLLNFTTGNIIHVDGGRPLGA